MRVAGPLIASIALACACSDPPVVPADGGTYDTGVPPLPVEIDPPAPPMPPVFTPCPPGWTETARPEGTLVCEPYASGAADACEEGFVHLPGEPACRRLGSPCPADGVPTGLPTGAPVVHVRAGSTGGDGSLASPFGTVGDAVDAAPLGAVVAIGPGTYDEAVVLAQPVTLFGACPGEVLLTSSIPDDPVRAGVLTIEGAGIAIQNLSVGQSERPGVWAAVAGAEVTLTDVIVVGADRVGIEVENGARLTARGLVVRDTKGGPTGQFGRGLGVQSGAVVEIRQALFERNREANALVRTMGSLLVEDALLRDSLPRASSGRDGDGFMVLAGGTARLARALVVNNRRVGVQVSEAGSRAEIEDVVVRGTLPQEIDGLHGRGLNVQFAAAVTARRLFIDDSRELAVFVADVGTTLSLSDAIVAGTMPRAVDGLAGRGITIQTNATATITRIEVDDNHEAGIMVAGDGASLVLTDAVVRRALPGFDGFGRGLSLQNDTSVVASRVRVEAAHGTGVAALGPGGTITAEDIRIVGSLGVSGRTEGRALGLQDGATGTFTRLALEASEQYGVMVLEEGTELRLTHTRVASTTRRDCGALCFPGGTALGAYVGGALIADTFAIEAAETCGVHIANRAVAVSGNSAMDLSNGEVWSCAIGACVQAEGFDVARLSDNVRYHDNAQNLDTTDLPVPGSAPSIATE